MLKHPASLERKNWPFIQFLDNFISVAARSNDDEWRQQRVFVASHISSLIIGVTFALYCEFAGGAHYVALVFATGVMLHAASLIALTRTSARVPLALFSGTVYVLQLIALVYLLGGAKASPTFVWWASLPVMALFMLRGPIVWVMTSSLFIITLTLGFMERYGVKWEVQFPEALMAEFTLLSTMFCLSHVTYLLWIVQRIQLSIESTLRADASTDSLTGALNHGAFLRHARTLVRTCQRTRHACVVAVFDMDNFKQINDVSGHAGGDDALKTLVNVCREQTRDSDIIGRLGGDEFAAVLPNADSSSGYEIMKRIQAALLTEGKAMDLPDGIYLSSSIGLAEWKPGSPEFSAADLLEFADQQMYDVKRTGRGGIGIRDALRPGHLKPAQGAGSAG